MSQIDWSEYENEPLGPPQLDGEEVDAAEESARIETVGDGRTPVTVTPSELHNAVAAIDEAFFGVQTGVYTLAGELVEIFHDSTINAVITRRLPRPRLAEKLAQFIRFEKPGKDGPIPCDAPAACIDAFMERGEWPNLPKLKGIINNPMITPEGQIRQVDVEDETKGIWQGYDIETGCYMRWKGAWPEVDYTPEDGYKNIKGLMSDVAFESESDFAAALVFVLTLMSRHLIDEPVPSFLIQATQKGTGKTTLARICGAIAYGFDPQCRSFPKDDEEMSKVLLSIALQKYPIVIFDNIRSKIGGPALEMALTTRVIAGRELGFTRDRNATMDAVFVYTANNPELTDDMTRRVVVISQDAKVENPSKREWKTDHIVRYCLKHRKELWNSACAVLSSHLVDLHQTNVKRKAQKPTEKQWREWESQDRKSQRFWKSDYPEWSRIVLGAVEKVTSSNPLASIEKMQEHSNPERDFLRVIVSRLAGLPPLKSAEILARCDHDSDLRDTLKSLSRNGMELPSAVGLGRKLNSMRGQIADGHRLEVQLIAGEGGAKRFQIVPLSSEETPF